MLSTKESITLTAEKIPDEVIIYLLVHLKTLLLFFSIEYFKIPDEMIISLFVHLKMFLLCFSIEHFKILGEVIISLLVHLKTFFDLNQMTGFVK